MSRGSQGDREISGGGRRRAGRDGHRPAAREAASLRGTVRRDLPASSRSHAGAARTRVGFGHHGPLEPTRKAAEATRRSGRSPADPVSGRADALGARASGPAPARGTAPTRPRRLRPARRRDAAVGRDARRPLSAQARHLADHGSDTRRPRHVGPPARARALRGRPSASRRDPAHGRPTFRGAAIAGAPAAAAPCGSLGGSRRTRSALDVIRRGAR